MKPTDKRGVWKAETAIKRLRRCLAFLRVGDFLSASEQRRIGQRVERWKANHTLRKVVVRQPGEDPKPSAMRHSIQERFAQFHFDNPQVFEHLVKLTQSQYLKGSTKWGVRNLWENLRWRIHLGHLKVQGDYQLNDHFHSRYVRLLIEKYPAYRGLFNTRHLRTP
jgi:hypothetical protein